jgi:group I intron endonuclease
MKSGIYKIYSVTKPERFYIGSASNLNRRKNEHFRRLRAGTHPNLILSRHFKKHGESDLVFTTLEICPIHNLIQREQFFIDQLNPYFNICKVAGTTIGRPQSEETKRKRADKLRGRKRNPESRARISNAHIKPLPDVINGFKVIDPVFSLVNGVRYALFECPNCHKPVKRKPKDIYSIMHCGCVKTCRLPKPKRQRINGIKPRKDSTSPYVGVTYDKAVNKWRARIKVNGKLIALGNFTSPVDGIKARQQYIINNKLTNRSMGPSLQTF